MLSYDPPFVMFSAGVHEADGRRKDTVINVEATGEFVYNMVTWAQKDAMNVRPPRVKGSPVHFECRLHQIVTLPGRKASAEHHVVIGQVVAVHIDDAALTADGRVDIPKIRPIARLGYKDYLCVDTMFQMEKRTPEDL